MTSTASDPENPDTGMSTGFELETGTDTGAIDDCVGIEVNRLEHDAFYGNGCYGAPQETVLLTSQDEVDAHTAVFCEACHLWSSDDCPDAPTLPPDAMVVYAWTETKSSPAHLEIVSLQDCGDLIMVEGLATTGFDTAVDRAWDSVIIPAVDKPIELHVDRVQGF